MDAINKMSDVKDALFYRELNAKLIRENRELKAENKRLNDCSDAIFVEILERGHKKEIRELKAEISQLKADAKHDADVCYDVDDKNHEWIEELKAEIEKLKADNISLFKRLNDANKQVIKAKCHGVNS